MLGALIATTALVASGVVASSASASTVDSDRAQIAQLQKQIAQKGAEIESLVQKASKANRNLDAVRDQIRQSEQQLATDSRAESDAQARVRQGAVLAYIGHSGTGSSLSMFDGTSSITRVMSANHYLNSVNAHWNDTIRSLELSKARADDDRRQLGKRQDDAQRVLDQLTRAQSDANAAITAQNATLERVRSDLTSQLITQNHQKAAARRAAQRAITAALAKVTHETDGAPSDAPPSSAPQSGRPTVVLPQPKPTRPTIDMPPPQPVRGGGYANPLRSVGGLSPQRIDSGVDYAGVGPLYAIGDGVVLNVYAADWPGGTFIAYRLSDGPAKGLVVYTAEDISPHVSVGEAITANTVIGQMYGGPHGIEIGWADGSRIPNAMARSSGQYHGDNSTAFGYNFSRFLQALGAPGGILQNNPTGALPAGWPSW